MLADKEKLDDVVEAILFVSGQGVELKEIAEKLEISLEDVKNSIENLKKKHDNDAINVITYKGSAQLSSNPSYAEDIATVLNPIREKQLTKAALETLAIIAYKQPITKLDIEQVRGVNSDYAVQVLTNFNLIEVVGRKDVVGKPLLYGTTDEFLKRFDLQSINDLPDYDELLSRIKILHETSDSLYKSTEIIPEEELPDSKARQEQNQEVTKDEHEAEKDEQKEEINKEVQENKEDNLQQDLPIENPSKENTNIVNTDIINEEKDIKKVLLDAFDEETHLLGEKEEDLL